MDRKVIIGALALLLVVPYCFANIFLLKWLWGLFIVPLGVMPISAAHAFGLLIILHFIHAKPSPGKKSNDESDPESRLLNLVIFMIAQPLSTLALGFITSSLMH